jgi:hypothetical protein
MMGSGCGNNCAQLTDGAWARGDAELTNFFFKRLFSANRMGL